MRVCPVIARILRLPCVEYHVILAQESSCDHRGCGLITARGGVLSLSMRGYVPLGKVVVIL